MWSKRPWHRTRLTASRWTFACAAALGTFAAGSAGRADDFYKGKMLTIVVGFSPGGGYDTYARVLARHIAAHISGNPNVIVQNMPGAGSLTSLL